MVASKTNPYDIFSIQAQRNHQLYEQMRNEDPVHAALHPQTGQTFWFLTRYDDCQNFLKDKRFGKEFRRHVPVAIADKWGTDSTQHIVNQHMLNLDEPAHARLRSLVHLAFTPIRINNLRAQLQIIADELFDVIDIEIADGEEFDLTTRYIGKLALRSIAAMLGIPVTDFEALYQWTHRMLLSDQVIVHHAIAEFTRYLEQQIAIRHAAPDTLDDVLSGLMLSENGGDKLSHPELLAMVFLLITAGYETMVEFMNNGIVSLFENPAQLHLLQAHQDESAVLKTTIEEMLRYSGPSPMTLPSWAFEDVLIGGKMIRQGDIVHAVLYAANRDPLVFADPHTFDILRQPNKHIAFSHGIHHCLGAALARLEGEVALATLLRRMPNL